MLPFLVVHGPVVWKLVLGLFVVSSVVIVRAVVRARERRRIVEALKIRYAGFNEVREGHVVLRAVFRGTRCMTLSGGDAAMDRCDGPASIELEDGTHVQIEGPIRVLIGTRVHVSAWGGPTRIDEVRDGDLVTARGIAAHGAAVGTGNYRESAGQWTLRADLALGEPLTIASRTPAIRARAMGPALALAIAGASVGGYFGLHAFDLHPRPPDSTRAETAFPPFGDIAVAAALPGSSRMRALRTIEYALEHQIDRSPGRDQMRDQIDDLLELPCDGYPSKAQRRLRDGRYEAALESARACGADGHVQLVALAALARYDEVVAVSKTADTDDVELILISAIATGRPYEAALADVLKRWKDVPHMYACLSSWLKHEQLDDECKPEAAYEVGADEPFQFRLMVGPDANSWLAQFVPASDLDDPKRMDLVSTLLVRGDFDAATSAVAAIHSPELSKLAKRAIQLRAGTAPPPVDESSNDEPTDVVDMSWLASKWAAPNEACSLREAIESASRDGDGRPIAATLRRRDCSLPRLVPGFDRLLAVLPHVTKGREEIAEALRGMPGISDTDPAPPMRAAGASLRRDLARIVGDLPEAERQAAIVRRAVAALGRRESVLAFRQIGL